jgi:hypothetical protein
MVYLPAIIVGIVLLSTVIIIIARGGGSLWRWLFGLEVLVLFECFGNCFVPGTWKQFWEIEIPGVLIAIAVAVTSSYLRIKKERARRRSSAFQLGTTPQMWTLYGVLFIVMAMLFTHL